MLGNYLIGLREGLEAALVVSILVAYLVKTERRQLLPRVWVGIGVAAAASLSFGALLTFGPRGLTFQAQELVGGTVSIVAVGFVTWMIFWMARAARSLSGELRVRIDDAAATRPWTLAVVALFAVGREGLETALFLWAATAATARADAPTVGPLLGALFGLVTAVVLGFLFYKGAVRVNLTRFFTWTGIFLILVAAGVLAYAVHDLQEGGFLPGLHQLAFDVSDLVPPTSWYGTLLKGVFNFSPATTVFEAVVWPVYCATTVVLFVRRIRSRESSAAPAPAASAVGH